MRKPNVNALVKFARRKVPILNDVTYDMDYWDSAVDHAYQMHVYGICDNYSDDKKLEVFSGWISGQEESSHCVENRDEVLQYFMKMLNSNDPEDIKRMRKVIHMIEYGNAKWIDLVYLDKIVPIDPYVILKALNALPIKWSYRAHDHDAMTWWMALELKVMMFDCDDIDYDRYYKLLEMFWPRHPNKPFQNL